MDKRPVHSDAAPAALGPYSQAIDTGDLVFCSGQVGIDAATGAMVEGGVAEQTHQVMRNLAAVLAAADLEMCHVAKTTIYLASMADFKTVNDVYGGYFTDAPPARATVEVCGLPAGALVEIDAIARRPARRR